MTTFETILIDDNEVDLFLHEKLIRFHGLSETICPFMEAIEALEYLRFAAHKDPNQARHFVIILDIKMPDMDGFVFLEHYGLLPAAFRERCRIIMVSASLHAGDTHRARAHHMVEGILKKPMNMNELGKVLRSED